MKLGRSFSSSKTCSKINFFFETLSLLWIFTEFLAFGSFRSGKIGLQDHGSNVKFRNIKIREL